MTMKLMMMVVLVALTTMTPALHAAALVDNTDKADDDYGPIDLSHIDPVDLCLFMCHSCFQQVGFNLTVSLLCLVYIHGSMQSAVQ